MYCIQVIRYNRLLVVVHQSLRDLLKALKGLVVMSEALETMFNSIYNNTVPELWAAKVKNIFMVLDKPTISGAAVLNLLLFNMHILSKKSPFAQNPKPLVSGNCHIVAHLLGFTNSSLYICHLNYIHAFTSAKSNGD